VLLFGYGITILLLLIFDVIAHDFYSIWLGMGILGPLLALLSWHFIENKRGIWGFRGMWLRIAADICVLTIFFLTI
jgi:hypothetical protein